VVLGSGAGVLLAAPIIVAFFAYLPHALVAGHAGALARGHLPSRLIASAVMPYFFGPIYGSPSRAVYLLWGNIGGYVTAALLFLSIVALTTRRRRSERLYLGAWTLLAVLITYGMPIDFGPVIGAVPLLRNTAFFRYAPPTWELAMVVLAVLGVDELLHAPEARSRIVFAGAVSLGVVAATVLVAPPLELAILRRDQYHFGLGSLAWAIVSVAVIAGAAYLLPARPRAVLIASVLLLDVAAMFVLPQFSAPRKLVMDITPVNYLEQHIGLERFATLGPIAPNYGSYWGIASVNENDLPVPKDWAHYVHQNLDSWVNPSLFIGTAGGRPRGSASPARELVTYLEGYQRAGVAYVVAPRELTLEERHLRRVFLSRTTVIYRVAGARPYFSSVRNACRIVVRSRYRLSATCRRRTTLIRRELYMAGWTATNNGRGTPVVKGDEFFQAIDLHAGPNTVTFSFKPEGATVSIAALIVGLVLLLPWLPALAAAGRPLRAAAPADSQPVRSL
jgi:hypothetical protein